MKIQDPISK
jgi:hypothetical protein